MLASGPLASSPLAAQSRVDVEVFVDGVSATGAIGDAFVNEVIVTGVSATGSIGNVAVNEVIVTGVSATGSIGDVGFKFLYFAPTPPALVGSISDDSVIKFLYFAPTPPALVGEIGEAKPRISVKSPPALRGSIGQVLVWSNRRVISGQGFVEIVPNPDVIFTPKTPSTPNKYIAVAPNPDAGYTETVPSTSVSWSKTIV
jgi:hypothetical protein